MRKFVLLLLSMSVLVPVLTYADVPVDTNHNKLIMQVVQDQFIFAHSNVLSVTLHFNAQSQYDGINVKLKSGAVAAMERMTSNGVGKRLNLVFNNKIISSAVIQSALRQEFIITGISREEASDFMLMLNNTKPE